jgi:N-acetylglucosaminyldiphosphoundecaprenol N-acetyl-beta-D-mannosaminyltransferase
MSKLNVLSISVNTGSYNAILKNILNMAQTKASSYTCIVNVHMLVEACRDESFAKVVNEADVATPDGKPLGWALKILYGKNQDRVAGMDLLPDLLMYAEQLQLPVYFVGGTEDMLANTRAHLIKIYPKLTIAGMHSPPFRTITNEEKIELINDINNSGAKLLFVCLGCPKQEKWMAAMKGHIQAAMVGVGGALPVMIGLQSRAPKWMQNAGLEWAFRLSQEPKRLFRRYAVTNSYFIYAFCKDYFSSRLISRNSQQYLQ